MEILIENAEGALDFLTIYLRGFLFQNIKYFLFAGLAFLILFIGFRNKVKHLKIWQKSIANYQILNEIKWSVLTSLIIGFFYVGIAFFYKYGYTKIYFEVPQQGVLYLPISLVVMILWHDTWFYWIHRFMHANSFLRKIHRIHHLSNDPSPFAAFAFHPIETLLEAGFMLIAIFVLPLHPIVIVLINIFQITMNVMGHSGHEFMPKKFVKHPVFKWFNTSTHHHMHHRYYQCNYGLYFNFWDLILRTNHHKYIETFEEVTKRKPEPNA